MKFSIYTKNIALGMALTLASIVAFAAPASAQYGYYPYGYAYPAITLFCSTSQASAGIGAPVVWTATVSGGNGSYSYSWSGDENLTGYSSSVTKTYYTTGYKNAQVTVTSGGRTATASCGSLNINGTYSPVYPTPYPYPYPTYIQYPTYPTSIPYQYPAVSVYCSANTASVTTGSTVTWTAYVSGQIGSVTYLWSGTDGLYGSGQSVLFSYINPGQKYGTVTVYANGQTATASCNNSVIVYNNTYYGNGYNNNTYYNNGYYNAPYPYVTPSYPTAYTTANGNSLNIGCYADPTSSTVSQPVTWTAEVTGGAAPYAYSWSGSDGLNGSQSATTKYYGSAGTKSATVTVTAANGIMSTQACSNAVTVKAAAAINWYVPPAKVVAPVVQQAPVVQYVQVQPQPATPAPTPASVAATSSLFSLQNVPWGWVAILIIIILFVTVLYLLFNREKI